MTENEFNDKALDLFGKHKIPMELRRPMSDIAYQDEHAYGYGEVFNKLEDMVYAFEDPIKIFRDRIFKKGCLNGRMC